ncbi:MAG: polymer-forming cytoskeletal protein [Gammaproteobacteria bacterium]|nr:polymer-forming cytoskeletal protein [Gammaproteobacteria bacterium]
MFGKKSNASSRGTKIDTLIGQNSELQGDIVFSGGLHVDGVIKGNVFAEADSGSVLSLSERGHIEGDVRVPNIVLNGSVKGDVHAVDHIELAEKARVVGNVYYKFIEMVRGAEVNGNLVHKEDGFQPAPKVELLSASSE